LTDLTTQLANARAIEAAANLRAERLEATAAQPRDEDGRFTPQTPASPILTALSRQKPSHAFILAKVAPSSTPTQ
jgi:hypothetical protein